MSSSLKKNIVENVKPELVYYVLSSIQFKYKF